MTLFLACLFPLQRYSEHDGPDAMRGNYIYQIIRYKDCQGISSELLILKLAQVQMGAKLRNTGSI